MLIIILKDKSVIKTYHDLSFSEEIEVMTKFHYFQSFKIYNFDSSEIDDIILSDVRLPVPKERHLKIVKSR